MRREAVAAHNFYGHLCTMMNAHFSAVVPNMRIMETDIDRIAWDAELFTYVPEYKDGYLIVPDRPGWGTEPVETALAKYPPLEAVGMIHRTPPPRLTICATTVTTGCSSLSAWRRARRSRSADQIDEGDWSLLDPVRMRGKRYRDAG